MDLEAIDRMGLHLYREPELAEVIQDALCEQEPPLRWSDWLERGTLERLAQLMSLLSGPASAWPDDLWGWVRNLEGDGAAVDFPNPEVTEYESIYPSLCAAFRVPAVQVEIGIPVDAPWQGEPRRPVVFGPPSVSLAKATLREAVNYKPHLQWKEPSTLPLHKQQENELEILLGTTPTGYIDVGPADDAIIAAVRANHPQATGYRLRIGTGDWQERTL